MGRRNAIDLFGEWARNGRDEGMEKGHFASVMEMFGIARTRLPSKFSAIDVGCGNGWAVRQLTTSLAAKLHQEWTVLMT